MLSFIVSYICNNYAVYSKQDQLELTVSLTDEQILIVSDWWPVEPNTLAKILKVKFSKDDSMTDTEQCASIIKKWMEGCSNANQFTRLIKLLEQNEYYIPLELFRMNI